MAKSATAQMINCPACGAKNPIGTRRCGSCGNVVEELRKIESAVKDRERRYQQDGFSIAWALVAFGVQFAMTALVLWGLPELIASLDFEGYYGMALSIPVWCVGGMLVGLISPGKTFIEPVVAALVLAFPTVLFLYNGFGGMLGPGQTVRTMPIFMYVIMAAIGLMFTLVGAYIGERIQMGPAPSRAN
jgi:hypothetical protein